MEILSQKGRGGIMEIKIKGKVYTINNFIVTGRRYRSTKRFKLYYAATTSGFRTARMINLWNGSLWAKSIEGKKLLLKRVTN